MNGTTRAGLTAWLDGLAERFTLIAPTAVGEQLLYQPVAGSSEITFDFVKTDLPAKEYFLPATHPILSIHCEGKRSGTIKRGKEGIRLEEPTLEEERVIFGLRPCDARALRILDALFLEEEPADSYYAERRERTTLIGLACREMGEECFCNSLGLALDDVSDVDLMLTEIAGGEAPGGGYAVRVVTEKGEAILSGLTLEEVAGSPPKLAVQGQISIREAEAWPEHFDDVYWARLADRCLSCRICTYVCPTCRCFDVRDCETSSGDIERLRAWDSCMAEGYRRIAGGHNPRPTKAERLRNRFYCKFCYYPMDFGSVACVGCGRCIAKCPVNVDIVEVLEDVVALGKA